jgi:hypothetical protein
LATLMGLREAAIPAGTRDRGRSAAVLYPQLRTKRANAKGRRRAACRGRLRPRAMTRTNVHSGRPAPLHVGIYSPRGPAKRTRPSSGIGSQTAALATSTRTLGRNPGSPSNNPIRTKMISGSSGFSENSAEPQVPQNALSLPSPAFQRRTSSSPPTIRKVSDLTAADGEAAVAGSSLTVCAVAVPSPERWLADLKMHGTTAAAASKRQRRRLGHQGRG